MDDRLKAMEKDIKDLIKAVAELPEKILEKADNRYAVKETEIMVKRVQWLLISTLILAVLYYVLEIKI